MPETVSYCSCRTTILRCTHLSESFVKDSIDDGIDSRGNVSEPKEDVSHFHHYRMRVDLKSSSPSSSAHFKLSHLWPDRRDDICYEEGRPADEEASEDDSEYSSGLVLGEKLLGEDDQDCSRGRMTV